MNFRFFSKKFSKKRGLNVSVFTPEDGAVKIHPASVNVDEKYFKSHYLTYHVKMRTTSKFLYDTTMIHPLAIVFFGDQIQCTQDKIIVADYFE